MTELQKSLIELVGVGVAENSKFSEGLCNPNEWSDLYNLACLQGMVCLAWQGLETLYKHGVDECPQELKLMWYGRNKQTVSTTEKLAKKATAFADSVKPLKLVVLKGIDYAQYWSNPLWREFGDLDCVASEDGFKIKDSGFKSLNEKALEIGCKVEDAGYKHSHIEYKGLTIENHRYLTSFGGEKRLKERELFLQELLSSTPLKQIGETNLYSPSAEFTAIFMLVHAHRHFMAEGIELRNVLDWYFFLQKEAEKLDWTKTNDALRRFSLERFAGVMTAFCFKHFGLKAVSGLNYEVCEELLSAFEDDIFSERYSVGNRNPWYICKRLFNRFKRMWVFRELNTVSYLKAVWLTLTFNSALKRNPQLSRCGVVPIVPINI